MSTKKKVLDMLVDMRDHEREGGGASVINSCIKAIEEIPECKENRARTAAPNYEAMYMKAMEELDQHKNMLACSNEVICNMRVENARLMGFKEAVERIFPERDNGSF